MTHTTLAATPPAREAEAFFKETEKEWMDVFYKQTAEDQADDFVNKWWLVLNLLERFQYAHAAKAVADERQRLVRLVDERVKQTNKEGEEAALQMLTQDEAYKVGLSVGGEIRGLELVRQWLTGDVGEKK